MVTAEGLQVLVVRGPHPSFLHTSHCSRIILSSSLPIMGGNSYPRLDLEQGPAWRQHGDIESCTHTQEQLNSSCSLT